MGAFVHLKRRASGVYVVRLVVPRWLRDAAGQGEVHRSTGCRDLAIAKIVAAEIAADWHARIASLRRMDPDKIRHGSIELLGEGYLGLVEAASILGTDVVRLAGRLHERRANFYVQAQGWEGWLLPDLYALDAEIDALGNVTSIIIDARQLNALGERCSINDRLLLRFGSQGLDIVGSGAPVHVQFFLIAGAHEAGFVADDPGIPLEAAQLQVRRMDVEALRRSMLEMLLHAGAAAPVPVAVVAPLREDLAASIDSIAKHKHRDKPLSALTAHYLNARQHEWKPDEARRQRDACSALVELGGDAKLGDVDRDLLRQVAEKLRKVPDRRDLVKRALRRKAMTWTELIEEAERGGRARLSPEAVQRLMEDIGSVFAWGVRQSWLRENPAVSLSGEIFKRLGGVVRPHHERRDAFSEEDLGRIFGAPWFVHGVGERTAKGHFHSYRPHYYWMPLLALYTGGRVNELAQLYLDDLRQTDTGVWYIDFNMDQPDKRDKDAAERASEPVDDGDGAIEPPPEASHAKSPGADAMPKRLKTINSIRVVPVHPRLIELGLLNYAKALREAGHARLFPELKWNATKGYGKPVSSWFDERFLGRDLKFPRDGRKVFHSFRHNFETALERAGAPPKAIKQLMGHSMVLDPGSATAPGYGKKRAVDELVSVIALLSPKLPEIAVFRVPEALEAVRHSLALKRRQRSSSAG